MIYKTSMFVVASILSLGVLTTSAQAENTKLTNEKILQHKKKQSINYLN